VLGLRNPWDLAFRTAASEGTKMAVLASPGSCPDRITSAPLMSCHPKSFVLDMALDAADIVGQRQVLLRKEQVRVICHRSPLILDST
jgi:hypothetical protein